MIIKKRAKCIAVLLLTSTLISAGLLFTVGCSVPTSEKDAHQVDDVFPLPYPYFGFCPRDEHIEIFAYAMNTDRMIRAVGVNGNAGWIRARDMRPVEEYLGFDFVWPTPLMPEEFMLVSQERTRWVDERRQAFAIEYPDIDISSDYARLRIYNILVNVYSCTDRAYVIDHFLVYLGTSHVIHR